MLSTENRLARPARPGQAGQRDDARIPSRSQLESDLLTQLEGSIALAPSTLHSLPPLHSAQPCPWPAFSCSKQWTQQSQAADAEGQQAASINHLVRGKDFGHAA
jgi:hypothetical protein